MSHVFRVETAASIVYQENAGTTLESAARIFLACSKLLGYVYKNIIVRHRRYQTKLFLSTRDMVPAPAQEAGLSMVKNDPICVRGGADSSVVRFGRFFPNYGHTPEGAAVMKAMGVEIETTTSTIEDEHGTKHFLDGFVCSYNNVACKG